MTTLTTPMATYFIIMFTTLLLQIMGLMMKSGFLKKKLTILIIIMAIATALSGLAAGSYIAPIWFFIAIIYVMTYRNLRNIS